MCAKSAAADDVEVATPPGKNTDDVLVNVVDVKPDPMAAELVLPYIGLIECDVGTDPLVAPL